MVVSESVVQKTHLVIGVGLEDDTSKYLKFFWYGEESQAVKY